MITKQIVSDFFDNAKKEGDLDFSETLLWGFFFLDSNYESLKALGSKLSNLGYKSVDIFEADIEDQNADQEFYLHVEMIGYHSVDTLMDVNLEFYELAKESGLEYDGFDVGPII